MTEAIKDLIEKGREILDREWREIQGRGQDEEAFPVVPEVATAIHRSINSRTKTYRYVLPTQLLAKLADPNLDCRCLQVTRGGRGAFDARSLCHKVIVAFDKENDFVLGGSAEPYVNNPLRQPEVSARYRSKQKDKEGWDDLCLVLETVEKHNDPEFTHAIWQRVLWEILNRLAEVSFTYPVPRRISLNRCLLLLEKFLAERSGGDRLLAVASALFVTIGQVFHLFNTVKREKINASDSSAGLVADLECLDEEGEIMMVVEVKDRAITINQIKDKLTGIRARQITEVFFLAQRGLIENEKQEILDVIEKEFASGQNLYVFEDLQKLAPVVLALLGESGRRLFLTQVGRELDEYQSDLAHRRAWKNLLSEL